MNFINKFLRPLSFITAAVLFLSGCGSSVSLPYKSNMKDSSFGIISVTDDTSEMADSFAASLCVVENNDGNSLQIDMTNASAAALFDVDSCSTLYAKNVFTRLYPASMTKIMTALVAMENASNDMILTVSDSVLTLGADTQTCGLEPGDYLTLDQALHLLLINSSNDAAIVIAENIAGSSDAFASMMNDEAKKLGATNTNFINSNGLSDVNHYSTVYDMYLIFNEALKQDLFREIIGMKTYTTTYHDADGNPKTADVIATNLYLTGEKTAPSNITVIGGKTGTTNAAGHCLILYSKNASGRGYISVVMQASTQDDLYNIMSSLLAAIPQ